MVNKEKTTKVPANAAPKMISVEQANAQMQGVIKQANQKIQQIAMQLQNVEGMLRDKTIDHLFKVVEYAHQFEPAFVEKCAGAITEYLTKMALEQPAQPENAPENPEGKEAPAETKEGE